MSTVSLIFLGLLIICPYYDAASFESIRSLMDLQQMMSQVTEDDPFRYNNYGNWCGMGGSGEVKDAIDGCCKVHDDCYGLLQEGVCKDVNFFLGSSVVYINAYKFEYSPDTKQATCAEGQEPCEAGLCDCDLVFSNCLRENKQVYNASLHTGFF